MTSPCIRILCVDDHAIVREGIALLLGLQPDMEVVALAASGEQAVARYKSSRPDITLMDLQLPGMSGLEAICVIRKEDPAARIVVLTMYYGDEDMHRALNAGAVTYLLKDTLSTDLVRVIREVHSGQRPIRPDVQARLAERAESPELTPREVEVLEFVLHGLRNKEIAAALSISTETVHVHIRHVLAKLGVSDRTAAVNTALRRGILHIR
jgi:DNA-binding NarL/FixJ family response regulator